ncbi:MAG: LysM peptidoglycan-binding domain-containing protein [Anaerolineaceae bacterium]|nr:LysM peptidoglycan-binding domain-containing protein [Anaerolineaceae bacterium]
MSQVSTNVLRLLLLSLCLTCMAPVARAQASNPEQEDCELPSSGVIVASVTYTLDEDCTQTGTLEIRTADTPSVTLTINGNGHTISNGTETDYGMNFLVVDDQGASTLFNKDSTASPNVKVIIKNVTFDGKDWLFKRHVRQGEREDGTTWLYSGGIGSWISAEGTLEMENVTFTNGNGSWLRAEGTATLSNLLFEDSKTWSWGFSPTVQGSLYVTKTGSVTLNNAVFRDIRRTAIAVEKGGSLTTTGCLSFVRPFIHKVLHSGSNSVMGTWTDSSSGPCTGSNDPVGNGGSAVVTYSPELLDCGLPKDAVIGVDSVYTLNQDCVCLKRFIVATGVTVKINANGHRIVGCEGTQFYVADTLARGASIFVGSMAHLIINNVNLYGVQTRIYGGALTVGNSMIADTSPTPIHNHGFVHVFKTIFQNNQGYSSGKRGSAYYATDSFRMGRAIFRDNMFRGNSLGAAEALARGGGTAIYFCGDNVREVPEPEDGAELPPLVPLWLGTEGGAVHNFCPENIPHNSAGGSCYKQQPLGAIGLICHVDRQPAAIEILEISRQSEGRRILRVDQSQIEASGAGLVACSADGRAAVRVGLTGPVGQMMVGTRAWRDAGPQRVIQVSMGPTLEDKVHHVVIDDVLDGHVLGTVDTRPDSAPCPVTAQAVAAVSAPAPVYAPPVVTQQPRADGSIIHVVQAGDTIWTIGVAYDVHPHVIIERNALGMRGRFIYPGQELLIREA